MKNHEIMNTMSQFKSNCLYRIEAGRFTDYFKKEDRLDLHRTWFFRPAFITTGDTKQVILLDTYTGEKGVPVREEMLEKGMIEFVCDMTEYNDLGKDPERVKNYAKSDFETVCLEKGEVHYLLRKNAEEDRERKLDNLIMKRNQLLWELTPVEREIIKTATEGENVYFPDSQHNLSAYSKEYFEKHENAFYDAFIHNLDTYSFDEWTTLEEFLNMSLSYDQYMAIAYYCNADEEIDGEILEISEFANRKKDLLDVAKNATHA